MTQLIDAELEADAQPEREAAAIPWRAFSVTVAGAFMVALDLSIEARGPEHAQEVIGRLQEAGFRPELLER